MLRASRWRRQYLLRQRLRRRHMPLAASAGPAGPTIFAIRSSPGRARTFPAILIQVDVEGPGRREPMRTQPLVRRARWASPLVLLLVLALAPTAGAQDSGTV